MLHVILVLKNEWFHLQRFRPINMQIIQIVSSISELGVVSFKFQLNVASYYQLIHVLIHDFDEDDRVKVTALPTLVHVSSIHRTSCSSQKF